MYLSVGVMWSCSYWRLSGWHVNVTVSVRVWYKIHWWRLGRRCAVLCRRAVLTGCHTRWQWRRRRMGRTLLYRLPLSLSLKHSKSSHTISKWTDGWIDGWIVGNCISAHKRLLRQFIHNHIQHLLRWQYLHFFSSSTVNSEQSRMKIETCFVVHVIIKFLHYKSYSQYVTIQSNSEKLK